MVKKKVILACIASKNVGHSSALFYVVAELPSVTVLEAYWNTNVWEMRCRHNTHL